MKINTKTAWALASAVLVLCILAAFGDVLHHDLGVSNGAVRWLQTFAGAIGATVLALLPKLFKDEDGDGVPDILERKDGNGSAPTPPTQHRMLVLGTALAALFLSGCGGAASVPVVMAGVETGLGFTCKTARVVCEWSADRMTTPDARAKHDAACAAIEQVCSVVAPGAKP